MPFGDFLGVDATNSDGWTDLYGTTPTSATTNLFQIVGTQNATSTTTTTVNTLPLYRTWVRDDQQARYQNIVRSWTYDQQRRIDQTVQIQQQANEQSGWVNVSSSRNTMFIQWTSLYGAHVAEVTERDRARAALARHDAGHRTRLEAQAIERAEGLLLSHLTPQQRADYERNKWFVVDGKSGRRYRINRGSTANVDLMLPDGRVEARLCAVLYDVPLPDQLLAQKLHIEMAEKEFLAVAIRHQPRAA